MSRSLSRIIAGHFGRNVIVSGSSVLRPLLCVQPVQAVQGVASYSKRNGSPSDGHPFKTVSKSRNVDDDDYNSLESEPNWELISKKNNRFYFPNGTGPAWQGDTTTVGLMEPVWKLVNFLKTPNLEKTRLEFACCQCPKLIRESLYELFPVRAVFEKNSPITLLTLSYEGDIEMGAAKFVLAARAISNRLISLGYWADFLNPFSGRPYYVPKHGKRLYRIDHRFRGLNMRLSKHNECLVIAAEANDITCFSATICTTAPNDYSKLVELLVPSDYQDNIDQIFR